LWRECRQRQPNPFRFGEPRARLRASGWYPQRVDVLQAEGQPREQTGAAQARARRVGGDAIEPGAEAQLAEDLRQRAPGGDEGVLREVASQLVIADEPREVRADARVVRLEERCEAWWSPCRARSTRPSSGASQRVRSGGVSEISSLSPVVSSIIRMTSSPTPLHARVTSL